MKRRFAAIFAADIVDFHRLMKANGMGTLARQKRHRAELIDPKINQLGGRIISLTGDGMIAEFPSVLEAIQCAVSIQNEIAVREAIVPDERKILYRVAVNLCDVIIDDDEKDVHGDGVSICALVAPPGGVAVSRTAYDYLKSNADIGYAELYDDQSKDLATSVRVY